MAANFPDHALPPEAEICGYRVMRFLGQGGNAITYQARRGNDEELVAIKEFFPQSLVYRGEDLRPRPLHPDDMRDLNDLAEMFYEEAETICKFNHPGVVRGIEILDDRGTAYLVMEYQTGQSLRAALRDEWSGFQVQPSTFGGFVRKLLDALDYCHRNGCLHCDLKPGNIYLGMDFDPVILDFGAARHKMNERLYSEDERSRSFTPYYAPVEQCPNGSGDLGPWTDIYQAGAVFYRCLTGGKILDAESRVAEEGYWPLVEDPPGLEKGLWPKEFLHAIDAALGLWPKSRPADIAQWRSLLNPALKKLGKSGKTEVRKSAPKSFGNSEKPPPRKKPETQKAPAVEERTVTIATKKKPATPEPPRSLPAPVGPRAEGHHPFLKFIIFVLVAAAIALLVMIVIE